MAPGEMRAGGVRSVGTVCRAGVGSVCLLGRFQQGNSVGGVRSAGFYGWFTKCASELANPSYRVVMFDTAG
jgi:hypothetical protein